MNLLTLVWANLWRKPARTILTGLSIATAFLLIGLLQGVNAGFAESIAKARRDVLTTDARVRGSPPMPISMLDEIRKIPGVTTVAVRAYFIGDYRPPHAIAALATQPRIFFSLRAALRVDESALAAIERVRDGIIVSQDLLEQFEWKVGDRLTVRSRGELQRDGSPDWTFEIVGTFDMVEEKGKALFAIINYAYLDEARITNRGTVERFFVRIADPDRSVATAAAIDNLFANSSHPTRTHSDQERAEASTQRLGDIKFFTNAVLGSVLFMLLFLTANITRQSLQERIPEYGVLKAMGFGGGACLRLALAEVGAIYLAGAILGLVLAVLMTPLARDISSSIHVSPAVFVRGVALALALAVASAMVPCWQVYRLSAVDALSGRRA
jgi:putative ABC transport system permease protein